MNIRSSSPRPYDPSIVGAHDDPASALVHAAIADRPLEEVANLITMLEQSPQYARATIDALRAVGTDRSVEDVTRLVTLLTQPPRDPASADEVIRAAAENRPVEEVTRLMALLHLPSSERRFGQEAAKAVAAARSVEDLVELIGRLSTERGAHPAPPKTEPSPPQAGEADWRSEGTGSGLPPFPTVLPSYGGDPMPRQPVGAPRRASERPPWAGLLVAAALFLCALLWFPMYKSGTTVDVYASGIAVSILYALLAVLVTLRPVRAVLVVATVLPALLAGAELYRGFRSRSMFRALDLTLAPGWLAGLAAVIAALAAVTALVLRAAARPPTLMGGAPTRPLATARRLD